MTSNVKLIDGSSLKHFNFTGWTANQILEKYENVLECRERQITDLTIELGTLNETLNSYIDKCTNYVEENDLIETKLKKKEAQLTQELTNKEILFMKLDRKEVECDELNKKYNDLLKRRNTSFVNPKEKREYSKVNEINEIIHCKDNIENNEKWKKELSKTTDNTTLCTQTDINIEAQQSLKTSVRNKIEKLKTKTNNSTKINFSNLFETQTEKSKEEIESHAGNKEKSDITKSTQQKIEDESQETKLEGLESQAAKQEKSDTQQKFEHSDNTQKEENSTE